MKNSTFAMAGRVLGDAAEPEQGGDQRLRPGKIRAHFSSPMMVLPRGYAHGRSRPDDREELSQNPVPRLERADMDPSTCSPSPAVPSLRSGRRPLPHTVGERFWG